MLCNVLIIINVMTPQPAILKYILRDRFFASNCNINYINCDIEDYIVYGRLVRQTLYGLLRIICYQPIMMLIGCTTVWWYHLLVATMSSGTTVWWHYCLVALLSGVPLAGGTTVWSATGWFVYTITLRCMTTT